jgi:hypothetical protein
MANLIAAVRLLEEHRNDLVNQLDAVETAIAALKGAERTEGRLTSPSVPTLAAPAKSRRPKRHFVLTDEHKQKLVEGRRRAREARAGADSASDASAPLVAHWSADGPPRLVKPEAGSTEPMPAVTGTHIPHPTTR